MSVLDEKTTRVSANGVLVVDRSSLESTDGFKRQIESLLRIAKAIHKPVASIDKTDRYLTHAL